MGTGSITSLPIDTIFETATTGRIGLCPVLESAVRPLSGANPNSPPSEKAFRDALDSIETVVSIEPANPSGRNIIVGSGGDYAEFKSIGFDGQITGWLDIPNDTICLSAWNISGTSESVSVASGVSVQGGIYQYSNTFDIDNVTITGNVIDYLHQDDVVGKIFVKVIDAVSDVVVTSGSTGMITEPSAYVYNIGTSGDSDLFATFTVPVNQTGLVDVSYSQSMSGSYCWIPGDTSLVVTSVNDYHPLSGKIGISVFYDHVLWQPNYGYVCGSEILQKINFSNELVTTRNYSFDRSYAPTIENSDKVYVVGGIESGSDVSKSYRFNHKIDTEAMTELGSLSQAVNRSGVTKSSTKAYVAGGYSSSTQTTVDTVQTVTFATDTSASSSVAVLNKSVGGVSSVGNTTYGYYAGGEEWSSGTNINFASDDTFDRIQYSSDTVSTIAGTLTTGRSMGARVLSSGIGYVVNGIRKPNTDDYYVVNTIEKIEYSSETVSVLTQSLPLSVCESAASYSSKTSYVFGGWWKHASNSGYSNFSQSNSDTIQKFDISTLSTAVINSSMVKPESMAYGASV